MKRNVINESIHLIRNNISRYHVIVTIILLATAGSFLIAGASAEEENIEIFVGNEAGYVVESERNVTELTTIVTSNLSKTDTVTYDPTDTTTVQSEFDENKSPSFVSDPVNVSKARVPHEPVPNEKDNFTNTTSFEIGENPSLGELFDNPESLVLSPLLCQINIPGIRNYPVSSSDSIMSIESIFASGFTGKYIIGYNNRNGLYYLCECDPSSNSLVSYECFEGFDHLQRILSRLVRDEENNGYIYVLSNSDLPEYDTVANTQSSVTKATYNNAILEVPENHVDYILPEQITLSVLHSNKFNFPSNFYPDMDGVPIKKNIPHSSVNNYLSHFYTSYSGEVGILDYSSNNFDFVNLSAPYGPDVLGNYWDVNDYMGSFTSGSKEYLIFGRTGGSWSCACDHDLQVVAVVFDFPDLSDVHVFYIDSSEEKNAGSSISYMSSVFDDEIIAYKGGIGTKYYRLEFNTIKNAINGNKFVEIPAYKVYNADSTSPYFPGPYCNIINKITDNTFYWYDYHTQSPDQLTVVNILTDEWESYTGYWDNNHPWPSGEIKRFQNGNDVYSLMGGYNGLQCYKYDLSALDFNSSTSKNPINFYWSYSGDESNQIIFDPVENTAYVFGYSYFNLYEAYILTKVSKIKVNDDLTGYQILFEDRPNIVMNQLAWFWKAIYPDMKDNTVIGSNILFDEPNSRLIPLGAKNITEFLLPIDPEVSDYYYISGELFERKPNGFVATVSYYNWSTRQLKSYVLDGDINPLIANFSASPICGVAPLNVEFLDTSVDTTTHSLPTSRSWDFGDGKTSNEINPTHTYAEPGNYSVTLTVTNGVYSATKKKSDLVIALNASPSIEWDTVIGGTSKDEAKAVIQTSDGEYIVAGYTESWSNIDYNYHGGGDAHIAKLKRNGTVRWQKCLGGNGQDFANAVLQTADGDYIVAGYTSSNDGDVSGHHGDNDFWVIKLKSNGTIDWQKCLGGSGRDYANALIESSDGGYVVAGYTSSNDGNISGNHGSGDFWVAKLASNGTIVWSQCLGGSGDDQANAISQTSDGGFIVAGYTQSNDGDVSGNHGNNDFWVVKLKPDGTIDWRKCLGGSSYEYANAIIQVSDGGYVAVGRSDSNDGDAPRDNGCYDYDSWIVKLSETGGIEWQKRLGGSSYDSASDIIETNDGGFIVAGETESSDRLVFGNHGQKDLWVVKLFGNGTIDWQRCLGGTYPDIANAMIQASDGGTVIAGSTMSADGDVSSKSENQWNIWIVKLRGNQQPPSSSGGHQVLIEKATAWAHEKEGSTRYTTSSMTYGLAFVRDAYQVGAEAKWSQKFEGHYYGLPPDSRHAKAVYNYLQSIGKIGHGAPPQGALVFYDCNIDGWEKYGHIALSLEDGGSKVIHVQPAPHYVIIDEGYDLKNLPDKRSERYDSYEYLGWAYPPIESPVPYSPVNGDAIEINAPVFKWNKSEWAGLPDPEYYALYISEYPYGEENLVFNSRNYGNGKIVGESFELPNDLPEDQKLKIDKQYRWNVQAFYGDGTSGYPAAKGYFTSGFVENNELPVANFTVSPEEIIVHNAVVLNASSSYDPDGDTIVNYRWDIQYTSEDPTSDIGFLKHYYGITQELKFEKAGKYNIILFVFDDNGQSNHITKTINVIENHESNLMVQLNAPGDISNHETKTLELSIHNGDSSDSGKVIVKLKVDPNLVIQDESFRDYEFYYDQKTGTAICIIENIPKESSITIPVDIKCQIPKDVFDLLFKKGLFGDLLFGCAGEYFTDNEVVIIRHSDLENIFYPGIGWTPNEKTTSVTAQRWSEASELDSKLMNSYYGVDKINASIQVWLLYHNITTSVNYPGSQDEHRHYHIGFSHSGGTQTLFKKLQNNEITVDYAVFIAPALLDTAELLKLLEDNSVKEKIIIVQSENDILYRTRLHYSKDDGALGGPSIDIIDPKVIGGTIDYLNNGFGNKILTFSFVQYIFNHYNVPTKDLPNEETFWIGGRSRYSEDPALFINYSTNLGHIIALNPKFSEDNEKIRSIYDYAIIHEKLLDWTIQEYNTGTSEPFIHLKSEEVPDTQRAKFNIALLKAHDPNIKYGPEKHVPQDQRLEYTIEYENEGDGTAFEVYFTDTLDPSLDASTLEIGPVYSISTGCQIADAGTYDATTRTINWTVGEVPPREGGYANISVKWLESVPDETVVTNYATVYFPSAFEKTQTNTIITKKGVNHPPSKPEIIGPLDMVDNLELTGVLSWACNDSNRDPLQYDIYLGTSSSPPLIHNESYATEYFYNLSGYDTTYYWKVVAKDPEGATNESDVHQFTTRPEHPLPVVNFISNIQSGPAPLTVKFFDTSIYVNNTSNWNWTFGDGGTSAEQNPVHIYNNKGVYNVTLEVSNEWGNTSSIRAFYINVTSSSMIANFTANVTSGPTPLTVHFTDTSTGNPTNRTWTFGDNATSTDQNPTHTYTAPGTYTVNLTVTNADGSDTCSREGYIAVLDPMHVGLGNAKAERGAVTTAYLTLSNATAIGAADLNLNYDPSVVTVDSVSSTAGAFASNINNENGITHIVFVDNPGLNGNGQICTVVLNATGEPGDISVLNVTVKELNDVFGTKLAFAVVPVPGVFQVLYPDTPNPTRYIIGGDLYKGIRSGNTVYLGEEGLNLTSLGDVRRLVYAGNLSAGIDVPDPGSFDPVYDGDFVPGRYYAWGADGQICGEPWVEIREPEATLDVALSGTTDSVHNSSVTRTADLAFTFENNLNGLYTLPAAAFVTIEVTTPTGETATTFGGRNLTRIPVNTSAIHLDGFDLTDTAAGTYTARAVWPASSDFAGKGYDSNIVAFEIVDRPLGLEASTDTVVRSHPFTVTVTGDNAKRYILYVADAGLEQEDDYPLFAAGQTGVQTGDDVPAPVEAANFSRTKAYVVTDSDGSRTVQFETTTLTANRMFTLRVVDDDTGQNTAEVQVRVEKGEVTVAASGSTATIGDEITLSGVNTDSAMTCLFLTGPGLPTSGVNTVNLSASVVSGDPSTFTIVAVKVDETWEYRWDTASVWGGALQEGTYTVYAVSQPKALADLDGVPYASTAIRFVSPAQEGNVSFVADRTSGVAPLTVHFTDTSANSPTSWSWTFGDNATSTDPNPTHTYTAPGTYTVTLSINGGAETCTKTAYIKVTPVLYGDANDDNAVNQADTLRVLKEVVGLVPIPAADTEQFRKTDVHRNSAIDVGDALFIAQYNVGLRDVWFAVMG
jgi:PKD repeat protein